MVKVPRLRTLIVIALVIVLVAAAYFSGLLFAVVPFSTESRFERYGSNNQDPDWDARGFYEFNTELLDSDQYIAAFAPDGSSEEINMAFEMCRVRTDVVAAWFITTSAEGFHWKYDIRLNGQLIDTLYRRASGTAQGKCPNGAGSADATYVTSTPAIAVLFGNEKTGRLDVTGYASMAYGSVFGTGTPSWYPFAYDSAQIKSGVGSCAVVTAMPVRPGTSIEASCNLGWATGKNDAGSWSLWVGDPDASATQVATMPNNVFDYRVTFPAPAESGIYNIHLLNGLFQVDWFQFTVTVNPDLAPPAPEWSVNPSPPYVPGDSVTLTWTAAPNSATGANITGVFVEVAYTDGTVIEPRRSYTGDSGTLTFAVTKTIDVHVSAVSVDENGEFSAPQQATLQVEQCDVNNRCQPPPGATFIPGLPLWAIFVILGIVLLLVAVFLKFISITFRIIIALIGVIMFLLAVIFF